MPRRVAKSSLNASTVDILNVIRQNAPYEYQQSVPAVENERDIPAVGEIIYGTPALANDFINALVNRIAAVVVRSATFNNPYAFLKKGYLDYGETVENVFVDIAKAIHYDAHLAKYREFQRTIPSVHSSFAVRNWKVLYPVTIEDSELRTAFLAAEGVTDLINRITAQVYTAAQYDEFLLFKYLIIKSVTHGQLCPRSIGDGTDLKEAAVEFKSIANELTFMSHRFNEAHVRNVCPKDRQVIFMDAHYNAEFDVNVLAAAFNMARADFEQRLVLVDSFSEFDNERFNEIREYTDGLEEVTPQELEAMQSVKAIVCDEEWFQVYDNLQRWTDTYVASGLYFNYFLHTWKTLAHSPFADAVVFITDTPEPYSSLRFVVDSVSLGDADNDADAYGVVTLNGDVNSWEHGFQQFNFLQTPESIQKIVAVDEYGAYTFDKGQDADGNIISVTPILRVGGVTYEGDKDINLALAPGDVITFTPSA